MRGIKILIILLSITVQSQQVSDWDMSSILYQMQKPWSIGNGCFEANFKVVEVYGGLELNGNTLEVMDVLIQVLDGQVTNCGNPIDINNHPLIIYKCESSAIVEYPFTLSVENPVDDNEQFSIYPNPSPDIVNIVYENLYRFEVYDLTGKLQLQGNTSAIDVSNLTNGLYILVCYDNGLNRRITKFIKQ